MQNSADVVALPREPSLPEPKITKIHLIGGPGSGKTYVASHLASHFGLPVLDLDTVFWDQTARILYTVRTTPEARATALANAIAQPKWTK